MNGAFYIGATGLQAQERALDVVANNIANLNTNGFKRSQARFSELVGASATTSRENVQDGHGAETPLWGVDVDTSPLDMTQGTLTQTGHPLDVAINGPGFIELMGAAGQVQLWRGGTLQVNPDGYLAAADGTPLKAMISVPEGATNLTISGSGAVSATVDGSATKTIGQIDVVQEKNPAGMSLTSPGRYEPENLNDVTSSAAGDAGAGVLVQGSLETSNVDLSTEMITMLLMQRAYASNAQIVQAGDQLMSIANELRR